MKKPMSVRQRNAIKACEQLLGIPYTGEDTAQGAFFYLREHIENARKEANRLLREESRMFVSAPVPTSAPVMKEMSSYRYDNAERDIGDEDVTYAETPTVESLERDIRHWINFL